MKESGYFAVTIYVCLYSHNLIIAGILPMTLWRVDSAAALKYNGYEFELLLAGHLDNGCAHWRGTSYVNE